MIDQRIGRGVLAVVFVALLATPFVMRHMSARALPQGSSQEAKAAALENYGFYFEEVAHKSGIDFVHRAPTLDPKLAPIMPEVASMGASVSIVDFDNDGWPDIYVTNSAEGSHNALYRNMHDGTFKDVAAEMGIADVNRPGTGVSMGAVWGDFDNDGYEDLLLIKWGRPELFHRIPGAGFERVTDQA
ncbi:MAG TPA: VCBS repeat-containing protein, partial [Casimicrobiaceae bacterium]|nr:VCBS repeat-containing protein [Casimicrobiaceae bacterium]